MTLYLCLCRQDHTKSYRLAASCLSRVGATIRHATCFSTADQTTLWFFLSPAGSGKSTWAEKYVLGNHSFTLLGVNAALDQMRVRLRCCSTCTATRNSSLQGSVVCWLSRPSFWLPSHPEGLQRLQICCSHSCVCSADVAFDGLISYSLYYPTAGVGRGAAGEAILGLHPGDCISMPSLFMLESSSQVLGVARQREQSHRAGSSLWLHLCYCVSNRPPLILILLL